MGSTERDIVTRVKAVLAGINGSSGGFNYDFSATDRVQIGQEQEPIRVPAVYLHPLTVSTSQTAGKTPLRSYGREFNMQLDVFVPATGAEPGNAILAALDAQSDVMKALENDRGLGSVGVHDLEIEASAYNGAEMDLSGVGVATLGLKIIYAERAGS